MSDPSEGSQRNTGRASDGREVGAAVFGAEAGTSAHEAPEFREEFLSRTPFPMNPRSGGFTGEIVPEMERRGGSPERSWRRTGNLDGKPTDSICEHGRDGSRGASEAKSFGSSAPQLTMVFLAAESAAGPCGSIARIAF
jgi:hypothetical protein